MKPNLLKSSKTQTAVLEKEIDEIKKDKNLQIEEESIETPKKEQKTLKNLQENLKEEHLENKKSLFNAFSANFEAKKEKEAYIKQKVLPEKKEEIQEEIISESLLDFKTKAKPKKKTSGVRFKLLTIVYAVVLGITVSWVGANAIRLAETQSLIHAQDVKYVQKLAELDKLKERENENAQLLPWDEILPVQAVPLENVTDYEQQSNWFDNIVNWFGKLFGG